MNTSNMLSAEERELSRLLGRPGADVVPRAGIDAAILAMARNPPATPAAAEPAPPTPQQPAGVPAAPPRAHGTRWGRRRRVVSSLAAVASLVLVVGLAWQLRPLPPPPVVLHDPAADTSSAPVSAPMPASAGHAIPAAGEPAAAAEMAAAMPADSPASAPAAPQPQVRPQPAQAPATEVAAAPATRPARGDASYAIEASDIVTPPAPPAPPAPLLEAAPAPAPTPTANAAPMLADVPAQQAADSEALSLRQENAARQRSMPPRPAFSTPAPVPHAGIKATEKAAAARQQQRQQADIEADTQLSRRQWLKRIRERRDNDDLAGARASLQRFIQAYPEARIPNDLRPLLEP